MAEYELQGCALIEPAPACQCCRVAACGLDDAQYLAMLLSCLAPANN